MATNNEKNLTDGFPPVTTEEWEQRIREDLQGADYEKKLIWETHDGYRIRPYYRRGDLEEISYLESVPGRYPYHRGSEKSDNAWLIREDFPAENLKKANREALDAIGRGTGSIGFDLSRNGSLAEKDIQALLKDLPLQQVPVNFILEGQSPDTLEWLHDHARKSSSDLSLVRGSLSTDPLGRLTETGDYRKNEGADLADLARCLEIAGNKLPRFRVLQASGNIFHASGASVTQELAFTLAMGNEYLVKLGGMGIPPGNILPHMQFRFSTGSSYFMEMAKLRAARYLWSKILQAYLGSRVNQSAMYILSQTSGWNQTLYDPHVNMLRGATQAMSAILGGTDSLIILPFNRPAGNPDPLARRIARNIQIILKEESYLDKVIDPAAGSYYIENLTDTLIGGGWDLFLETEERGGYQQALIDGFIQEQVRGTARKKLDNLARRREMLIGTNQYPIFDEKAGRVPEPEPVPLNKNSLADPLITFRAAREFEQLRLKTEQHKGGQPVVFIIPLGNLAMRRARAMFTMNFFACAGFRVLDNIGKFKTVREGMEAAREAGADIVVLCSSDEEYPAMAGDLAGLAGSDMIPVIAGYPKEHAGELKKAGIKHFIYTGANVLEELRKYQDLTGISTE